MNVPDQSIEWIQKQRIDDEMISSGAELFRTMSEL